MGPLCRGQAGGQRPHFLFLVAGAGRGGVPRQVLIYVPLGQLPSWGRVVSHGHACSDFGFVLLPVSIPHLGPAFATPQPRRPSTQCPLTTVPLTISTHSASLYVPCASQVPCTWTHVHVYVPCVSVCYVHHCVCHLLTRIPHTCQVCMTTHTIPQPPA